MEEQKEYCESNTENQVDRRARKVHFAEFTQTELHEEINENVHSNYHADSTDDIHGQKTNQSIRESIKREVNNDIEVNRCNRTDNGDDNGDDGISTNVTNSFHSTVNAMKDKDNELEKLLREAALEREMFEREREQAMHVATKRKKQGNSQQHEEMFNQGKSDSDNGNSKSNKKKKVKVNVKANNRSNFTHFRNKDFTPKHITNDKSANKIKSVGATAQCNEESGDTCAIVKNIEQINSIDVEESEELG